MKENNYMAGVFWNENLQRSWGISNSPERPETSAVNAHKCPATYYKS